MTKPVLFFFGPRTNVGVSVLTKFSSNGWRTVAIVRRLKGEVSQAADLVIKANFGDHDIVSEAYKEAERKMGSPNCVIYNAYAADAWSDDRNPFFSDPDNYSHDLAVNSVSFYATAHHAVESFEKLDNTRPKVFIFTGNLINNTLIPEAPGLGSGINASAYLVENAATVFGKEGKHNWYYADERLPNGLPLMMSRSAEAHAETFFKLATSKEQGHWSHTFVRGEGYRRFEYDRDRTFAPIKMLLAEAGIGAGVDKDVLKGVVDLGKDELHVTIVETGPEV